MKKPLLTILAMAITTFLYAQLEAFKIVGKNSEEFSHTFGIGAFLKISTPVNQDADEITGEIGILGLDGYTAGFASLKLGYRYTFNRTGYGFYLEPQAGYALGNDTYKDLQGVDAAASLGYLFQPLGGVRFDVAFRVENVFTAYGSYSFVGLRIAHNFTLFSRQD